MFFREPLLKLYNCSVAAVLNCTKILTLNLGVIEDNTPYVCAALLISTLV